MNEVLLPWLPDEGRRPTQQFELVRVHHQWIENQLSSRYGTTPGTSQTLFVSFCTRCQLFFGTFRLRDIEPFTELRFTSFATLEIIIPVNSYNQSFVHACIWQYFLHCPKVQFHYKYPNLENVEIFRVPAEAYITYT